MNVMFTNTTARRINVVRQRASRRGSRGILISARVAQREGAIEEGVLKPPLRFHPVLEEYFEVDRILLLGAHWELVPESTSLLFQLQKHGLIMSAIMSFISRNLPEIMMLSLKVFQCFILNINLNPALEKLDINFRLPQLAISNVM